MVNGPSPGPAPAAQARDSNSRLTRSNWRTWPHRKLRRKVPRVDGALTTQPMAPPVPPVRNTSASSMKSPPASAEATRVSSLSPGFARPGASPRSTWLSTTSRRPRCWARVTGSSSPALATRRWSSKAIRMRSGWLRASIYWVLLVLGSALLFQNHYPRFTGAPSCRFRTLARRPPSVDSGLRRHWRSSCSTSGWAWDFPSTLSWAHSCGLPPGPWSP